MTFKKWLHGGLAATAGCVFLAGAATAGAPMVKTPAPGFHRMMLGEFEITALSDSTVALPMTKLLTNTTPAKAEKMLARQGCSGPRSASCLAISGPPATSWSKWTRCSSRTCTRTTSAV